VPGPCRKTKRRKRLTPRERELASRFIPQEHRTKKYSQEQAVAIGLSRARRRAGQEELDEIVKKYT
jgi:hypothetical protein